MIRYSVFSLIELLALSYVNTRMHTLWPRKIPFSFSLLFSFVTQETRSSLAQRAHYTNYYYKTPAYYTPGRPCACSLLALRKGQKEDSDVWKSEWPEGTRKNSLVKADTEIETILIPRRTNLKYKRTLLLRSLRTAASEIAILREIKIVRQIMSFLYVFLSWENVINTWTNTCDDPGRIIISLFSRDSYGQIGTARLSEY